MKKELYLGLLAAITLLGFVCSSSSVSSSAEDVGRVDGVQPRRRAAADDGWPTPQMLESELSTDTTPEPLSVGNLTYSIPRNYIYNHYLKTLKVTYPGMEPFSERTRDCFDAKIALQIACRTIEIYVEVGPYSWKTIMKNGISSLSKIIRWRDGPFGYKIYEYGPDNARVENYVDFDKGILFDCLPHFDEGKRFGICDDRFSLADGNSAAFFFQLNEIGDVSDIETAIRKLMATFPHKENSK